MVEHHTSNILLKNIEKNGKYPLYDAKGIVGKSDFFMQEDYITIIKFGGVGRLRILPKHTGFGATMTGLTSKNSDIYFIYYLLSSYFPVDSIANRTVVPNIYFKDYKHFEYFVPSIDEQQKIAKVFKNIDNLLNLYELKLQKIEVIKKSLLDKMFV
ncbi:restriction endonuclease subunit S [Mesomycoplasma conjunctivae]|uniref:restriction endonuclease subunit S n=1 Tax=Mesomycoplasma conjunctivae TaxID=45361 RepID=UPI003DA469C1